MTEKELHIELTKWFDQIKVNRNFWHINPIGKLIKLKLKELKHWKNLKQGDAKHALAMKLYYKELNEGNMDAIEPIREMSKPIAQIDENEEVPPDYVPF